MRIVKKMASAATIAVFLLCCYFIVSSGSQADCNVYAATGSNFTVQLKHVLKDSDSLRWFKNKKVIFLRKSKLVIRGKNDDVDSNGKLKLTQLTKDKSGRYRPEVHREDGTSAVDLPSVRLCVLDPVQKPKVTVTCDKTKVTFTCDAGQSEKNFPIKWFMDNKNGPENETGKELKRPVKDVLNARFSCNVSNPVSSEISQPVQQDCIKSSFPDICGIDVCIPVRTGAGILLLVILIVIVCCIQRKANLIKDKVELPLRKHHHHHQKQLVGSVLEPDICADCDLEGDNRI